MFLVRIYIGGVDLVVPGGSHPAQRQDLSAGLCCRLLRRLLPLPPSNLPRPHDSHLSGEDFFYLITDGIPFGVKFDLKWAHRELKLEKKPR